jgi:hypothetical protein
MAKAAFSADSAHFPALILPALAGLQPPPDGARPPLAAHGAPLTTSKRN